MSSGEGMCMSTTYLLRLMLFHIDMATGAGLQRAQPAEAAVVFGAGLSCAALRHTPGHCVVTGRWMD